MNTDTACSLGGRDGHRSAVVAARTRGPAHIIDLAFSQRGHDALITSLMERVQANPHDAAALMDLASIFIVRHKREEGLPCRWRRSASNRCFRQSNGLAGPASLKVLMFAAPGRTS